MHIAKFRHGREIQVQIQKTEDAFHSASRTPKQLGPSVTILDQKATGKNLSDCKGYHSQAGNFSTVPVTTVGSPLLHSVSAVCGHHYFGSNLS